LADSAARPPLHIRAGETIVRNLRLRRGARLEGFVRAASAGVAGARIVVRAGRSAQWISDPPTTVTGADGRYEFAGLDEGRALLVVEKQGMYQRSLPGEWWTALADRDAVPELTVEIPRSGSVRKDLELVPGAVVAGLVEDESGDPLANVRVSAPNAAASLPTGVDGAFRVTGVVPGRAIVLTPEREGFVAAANAPVTVTEGRPAEDVVVRMHRVPHVRGRVRSRSGVPLEDASVRIANFESDSVWIGLHRWTRETATPVAADGTFELPVVAAHSFVVRASATGHADADSGPIAVVDGRDPYQVDLVLEQGRTLVGRVVTHDGAAVAGAEVQVAPHPDLRLSFPLADSSMQPTVWAVSDASGSFRVPCMRAGPHDVRAAARGFVSAQAVADPADEAPLVLVLAPDRAIEGVVQFRGGRPAEGFLVFAAPGFGGQTTFGGLVMDSGLLDVTDPRGRFRIAGLADIPYRLHVGPPETPMGAPSNVRRVTVEGVLAGASDVKVLLDEGGVISGRVTFGRGAAKSAVHLQARPPGQFDAFAGIDFGDVHELTTQADGSFAFGALGPGPYDLYVSPPSREWQARVVRGVPVGTTGLEVQLERGLSISGSVTDESGRALPSGTILQAVPVDGEPDGAPLPFAAVDDQGRFEIGGVSPGGHRLEIAPWTSAGRGRVLTTTDAVQAGASGLRLVAVQGGSIAGIVVDESGAPVPGASVRADAAGGAGGSRTVSSGDDGRFEVSGLRSGTVHDITAAASGRVAALAADVAFGRLDLRLVLARGLTASGRVIDSSGAPVRRAYLRLRRDADGSRVELRTDAEGRFSTSSLAAGKYEAETARPSTGGTPRYESCGSLDAGSVDVTLRLK
jgi:carboxypeptidase family protein